MHIYFSHKAGDMPDDFYTPIAANLIASENRERFSPPIDADTLGDFFRRSRRCGSFKNSCDKIAQPDRLILLAIRSNDRRKSRERAHLAILYRFYNDFRRSRRSAKTARCAWCSDCDFHRDFFFPRRKSAYKIADIWRRLNLPAFAKCARSRDILRSSIFLHDFSKLPHRRDRRKKSPSVSALIGGENRFTGDQIRRDRRIKSPGVSPAFSRNVKYLGPPIDN